MAISKSQAFFKQFSLQTCERQCGKLHVVGRGMEDCKVTSLVDDYPHGRSSPPPLATTVNLVWCQGGMTPPLSRARVGVCSCA